MRRIVGTLIAFGALLFAGLLLSPAEAATLYVSEFQSGTSPSGSDSAQIVPQTSLASQTVSLSGTAAASAAFNSRTHFVRLICDQGCSVKFGATAPTAVTTDLLLQQGEERVFGVSPGWFVSAISNPAGNIQVGGYEFNASVIPTVQNAAYAAGQPLGGLLTISIGSTSGLSGILTQINIGSTGGSTANMEVYVWSKNPSNTTCTDKTNFVRSQADNQYLIGSPQSITPALAVTAQDATTYGAAANLVMPFVNGSSNTNLYVCILANAAVTPASTTDLRLNISGIKDQP